MSDKTTPPPTSEIQIFKNYHSSLLKSELNGTLVYKVKSNKELRHKAHKAGLIIASLSLLLKVVPNEDLTYSITHFLN